MMTILGTTKDQFQKKLRKLVSIIFTLIFVAIAINIALIFLFNRKNVAFFVLVNSMADIVFFSIAYFLYSFFYLSQKQRYALYEKLHAEAEEFRGKNIEIREHTERYLKVDCIRVLAVIDGNVRRFYLPFAHDISEGKQLHFKANEGLVLEIIDEK